MSGWIAVSRDIFQHDFFATEPMSEREAWVWMIARAAWEDTTHRVGSEMLSVLRGSFFCTLRELQSAWGWGSDTRVRAFLKRTQEERMIECKTNAKKTHITICNYDNFQHIERKENAKKTQPTIQNKRTKEQVTTKQEEIEVVPTSISKEEEGASARVSISILEEVMTAVGVDPSAPGRYWKGAPATTHVLGWQVAYGLTDDEVIDAARISRTNNPEPPDGPKALDKFMAAYAKAKASASSIKPNPAAKAAPATPSKPVDRQALIDFWAKAINAGGFIASSSIRPDLARDMLAQGLVTPDQLKAKGIQA